MSSIGLVFFALALILSVGLILFSVRRQIQEFLV